MNRTVQEQLREYFEYFESSLETNLSADRLTITPRQLDEQPPRPGGPGWAVAVGVAMAALALVALAAVVVNALDRAPAETTTAPAVTTTTAPVETTVPDDSGRVVRDAGPAEQVGWKWLDHGDVGFPFDAASDSAIVGMLDAGVVVLEGGGPAGTICQSCVLQLWGGDGTVQSHPLDIFEGQQIFQMGVSANLIWFAVGEYSGTGWYDDRLWVSADGGNWVQVKVEDPAGVRQRLNGSAFDDLWFVRFLRSGDRVLAINRISGLLSVSTDQGQSFEVLDPIAAIGSQRGIRRTWATEDGFYIVNGPSPQLWHSPDGVTWDLLGDIQGIPAWNQTATPGSLTPEPYVLPLVDGRLLTMSLSGDISGFVSEDNGLSWEPIPGPYPFEDPSLPLVNQGWMHVIDTFMTTKVWVSADGYDWYLLPARTASSGNPASGVFVDGNRVAIPPQVP